LIDRGSVIGVIFVIVDSKEVLCYYYYDRKELELIFYLSSNKVQVEKVCFSVELMFVYYVFAFSLLTVNRNGVV
jgi:hypothetical protein